MPRFAYTAKDNAGRSVKGIKSTQSDQQLKRLLLHENLVIVSIREVKERKGFFFSRTKVRTSELVIFCRQMASMLKGGVPLIRAIDTIADESKNELFQNVLKEAGRNIRNGESFSQAIKNFPEIFPVLFAALAESGEKVGSLDVMLDRVGTYLEARDRLNKKIISALVYPVFIILFFTIAMFVFTLFLIPRFRSIYDGFHARLPLLTRAVFGLSDLMVHNMFIMVCALVLVSFFIHRRFFKTKKGRHDFDSIALKIPVFGSVIKNAAVSKFARTLATLLGQGISVGLALELVGDTAGNEVIRESSLQIKKMILDGENIPKALKSTGVFPALMIQMATVGVESGNLPELLNKTADFYEEQVDSFVSNLTNMMEPVLLAVLGAVVGVVIVALYMPIFKLSQAVTGIK